MLFDLVDSSKERTIDIKGIFNPKHVHSRNDSSKYSILKTERSTSSIITRI